jgi:uncharacterized membrane protein YvlD (DUF360 family)
MNAPLARGRLRIGDVVRFLIVWCACVAALLLADLLLPGLSTKTWWAWFLTTAVAAVAGLLVRPVLVVISARLGWVVVVLVGFFGQAGVVYLSFLVVPGVDATFWAAFVAAWLVAVVSVLVTWVMTTGTDDAFVSALVRRHRPAAVSDPEVDGVVFVQLDGVPFPVLRWAVQAGAVPTIRRWLSSGSHTLHEWTPQLPCTTPASQLGILHGTVAGVPAFRWYDRELGRVLVSNRPKDAAIIEERASTGRGLLADGGLSLSNLFTGDAPRAMLTMSRVAVSRGTTSSRETVARYLTDPRGFGRGLQQVLGEVVKERFQARRQTRRDLVPRIERDWTFAGLRAATNVLQRDLNTSVLAEELARGTRCVYVDYVDYDEIAHHAGIFRPESLASLDGLDRVLATLERLAERAPRRYHLVILSDHGQSQGEPFASRFGVDLGDLCEQLMAQDVDSVSSDIEGWGRAGALATDVAGDGLSGKVAARAAARVSEQVDEGVEVGTAAEISVLGSGNLGLLYVHGPRRLTLEEIDDRWPVLVPGLSAHEGIGFVAGIDAEGRRWVIGTEGRRDLDSGAVTGQDPLAPYAAHAAEVLGRALAMPEAPDLYVNSSVDASTLDIAAFEPLVGAHGGLGGWQDRAVLMVPRDLAHAVPEEPIVGADRLHQVLVRMLESLGHRSQYR